MITEPQKAFISRHVLVRPPGTAKHGTTLPQNGTRKGNSMITTNTYTPLKITDMSAPRQVPESEIAARAYEIFLSQGASDGHDLDDWLQAERERGAEIADAIKAGSAKA